MAIWRDVAADGRARLATAGVSSPEVEARRLVERAAGFEQGEYHLRLDDEVTTRALAFFDTMLRRRVSGEPLQYVVGVWGFRTLDLIVDARVLIPRPETEMVGEVALRQIDRRRASLAPGAMVRVVDLGTGSGALGLSIAAERGQVHVLATDVSAGAIEVARANLAGLGLKGTRVRLAVGSWFDAMPAEWAGTVDMVVSNPPYIGADEVLPAEVRDHEPVGALVAGPSGLEALEHILDHVGFWLAPGGSVVLEIAPHQAGAVAARAEQAGLGEIEVVDDLNGRARVVAASRPDAAIRM